MTDTTAKIRAKGLDSTGVTTDLARKMWDSVGGHYVAIVDLQVKRRSENDDGDRTVELVVDQIEPVIDGGLNGTLVDHVRTIQAALHRNRMLAENGPQLPIDGDEPEPTVKDVLAHGLSLVGNDDDGPVLWDGHVDDDDDDPEPDSTTVGRPQFTSS